MQSSRQTVARALSCDSDAINLICIRVIGSTAAAAAVAAAAVVVDDSFEYSVAFSSAQQVE